MNDITLWYKRILPSSLFSRLLISFLGFSLAILAVAGAIFYMQAYRMLDDEAGQRLLDGAQILAKELNSLHKDDSQENEASEIINKRFAEGQTFNWIQNAYWVDLQGQKPKFKAFFSASDPIKLSIRPPSVDEVEDMIDDGLAVLETGQPYFPDPFSLGGSRRFKIVFVPQVDSDGILATVVGLEADLQYLDLYISVRNSLVEVFLIAIIACLAASTLLAESLSKKIRILLEDLKIIVDRKKHIEGSIGIKELDLLRQGLIDLGETIETRNREIHGVFEEKLNEIAFIGGALAHEIRNPLSAIALHFGLIRRRYSPHSDELEPFTEIEQQIEEMKSLVEEFLRYSKKVIPQKLSVNLQQLLGDLVQSKKAIAGNIELECKIPINIVTFADPAMLKQIFENLINNSFEAKPEGLIISVSASQENGKTRIDFSDNGPGITPELLPRLFAPFSSGKSSGHGIGLALVKKFIDAHNGRIYVVSETQPGAHFVIEIPEVSIN